MASSKKRAANRRNARLSTGPRTEAGKAVSAANATRHGILSASPVIEDAEDETKWQQHLVSTLLTLAPVGYMEEFLARRIALQAWRLDRVQRCEVALAQARTASFTNAEVGDVGDSFQRAIDNFNEASRDREAFEHIAKMNPWEPVPEELATRIFRRIAQVYSLDLGELPLAPAADHAQGEEACPGQWTAAEVVRVATEIAQRGGTSPHTALMLSARCNTHGWNEKVRRMDALRQQRILPETRDVELLLRYEVSTERSLFRTLHELERLQAHRRGAYVPVPAVVDVTLVSDPTRR